MKAALIIPHAEHGGRIELREVDKPQPQAGEVLIRIEATAINRGEIGPRKAHRGPGVFLRRALIRPGTRMRSHAPTEPGPWRKEC